MVAIYAQDGVDTEAGDDVGRIAAEICRASYQNSRFVQIIDHSLDHFRGLRTFRYVNVPCDVEQTTAPDGIGTKVFCIDLAERHFFAPWDLLQMGTADIYRKGGRATILSNVLDVQSLGEEGSKRRKAASALYRGLGKAAADIGVVVLNGETAELGLFVGSESRKTTLPFNWAGVCLGLIDPKRLITGKNLAPGQVVVALYERGFRSNGWSVIRKAFEMRFNPRWYRHFFFRERWWDNPEALTYLRKAVEPSVAYDNLFAEANGWNDLERFEPPVEMTFIAHISGGGIRDKFGRDVLLRLGLSAELHDLFDPPEIMRHCAEWRGMGNKDLYSTWNCGQGMLTVLRDEDNAKRFLALAHKHNISAKICGKITSREETPKLVLTSKFDGKTVTYTK